jgi:hypothetical protein
MKLEKKNKPVVVLSIEITTEEITEEITIERDLLDNHSIVAISL